MAIWDFMLKLDGVDVTNYGFYPAELRGNWDGPDVSMPEAQIPGQDGAIEMDDEEVIAPLDLLVIGQLMGTSSSNFEDKRDALNLALYGRSIAIIGGNQTDRARIGRVVKISPAMGEFPELDEATTQIKIRCPNPLLYKTSATTVTGAANTDLACPQGTAWSRPVITVTGASSPLVITPKTYGGVALPNTPMTIAAAGLVVVDTGARTILDDAVRADSALTAGDFFRMQSTAAERALSHWPTIRASSGTVSITYYEAFL
jgi:hypothetical protein